MRTCNGSEGEVSILGPVLVASVSPAFHYCPESSSVRGVVVNVRVRPEGSAGPWPGILGTVLNPASAGYLLYVEPKQPPIQEKDRRIAVIDQWAIIDGQADSFSMQYANQYSVKLRRTPPKLAWPAVSLPVVGTLDSLFDVASGMFNAGAFPLTMLGSTIPYIEGGEVFVVCERQGLNVQALDLTAKVLS